MRCVRLDVPDRTDGDYAAQHHVAEDKVWQKLQLGIYSGLFTIALGQTTATQPALADHLV